MTYGRLDDWFLSNVWADFTWTNFSFGKFSVARMLIINGGAIRTTERYYFFSVWGGGGSWWHLHRIQGYQHFRKGRRHIEQTIICMKNENKIATSDSYVGRNVLKICIMVTKWLPEAILDIPFWPKCSHAVRYHEWSYNACIKCGNNRPVWYLYLLVIDMYISMYYYIVMNGWISY